MNQAQLKLALMTTLRTVASQAPRPSPLVSVR